jgi:hypothetical protein
VTASPVNPRKGFARRRANQFDQFAPIHLAGPVLDAATMSLFDI